jgi:threonine dehydratase
MGFMMHTNLNIQDFKEARERIQPYIRHTPLEYNWELSSLFAANIFLKLENLQVTGSFKARGSFNKLLTLTQEQRERGVIAPSAGNHGIGLAYAAHQLNIPALVYLPKDADSSKVKALEQFGALNTFFDTIEEARVAALEAAENKGYTFLSAYNDPSMIAAGGTIGLEILEDLSDVDIVISCLGGGGLTAGLCLALKAINPRIEVWGVQTENSPTFAVWNEAGKAISVDLEPSIAEGLSGPIEPETITFPIIHRHIDRILTVSEKELIAAMKLMLNSQYMIEPSGAAGVACLPQVGSELNGRKVAIIITGRNISWSRFRSLVSETDPVIDF